MKELGFGLLLIMAVVLIALGVAHQDKSDRADIESWANENQVKVVKIERCHWSHPFWLADEDDRIYEATIKTNNSEEKLYFKYNLLLGRDIKTK